MKLNRKIILGLSLLAIGTTSVSCSKVQYGTLENPCKLVKAMDTYKDFQLSIGSTDEKDYTTVTVTNTGDKYTTLTDYDNAFTIHDSDVELPGYPFEDIVLAPQESVTAKVYKARFGGSGKYTSKYYTSEYTKMEFKDFKLTKLTREERYEKEIFSDVLLSYTPKGKFIAGDNYHLLVNLTYDGKVYNVMSADPIYEMNAFGLELRYPYRTEGSDIFERYNIEPFDISKCSINWVKCYTAWFGKEQLPGCQKYIWRCYHDKKQEKVTNIVIGIGIPLVAVASAATITIIVKKKKKERVA